MNGAAEPDPHAVARQAMREAASVAAALEAEVGSPGWPGPTTALDQAVALDRAAGVVETTARERNGLAAAVSVLADVVTRIVDGYADLVEPGGPDDGPHGVPVVLRGRPGEIVATSVWLHNLRAEPLLDLGLRMTSLTCQDGSEIGGGAGRFTPTSVRVDAEATGEVTLSLTVPAAAAPGHYHGHVLATGMPGAAVPVRLVVRR